jgi:uncharacterized protein involved in outer membrane biogenesis
LRTGLITILVIVLLATAALVALPSFLPSAQMTAFLANKIKGLTGFDLVIRGDARFRLLPSPSFAAADIHVANPPGAAVPEFIKADAVRIKVALWPLLSGRIEVEGVTLIAPDIDLEVLADGSKNWRRAKPQSPESQVPSALAHSGVRMTVAVHQVEMISGTVTYRHGGKTETVQHLDADFQIPENGGVQGQADLETRGQKLHLDARAGTFDCAKPIPVSLRASAPDSAAKLDFEGLAGCTDGKIATVQGKLAFSADSVARAAAPFSNKPWPDALDKPVSLESTLTADTHSIQLKDLSIDLDRSHGVGALAIGFGKPVSIDLNVNFDRIDLDRWLQKQASIVPSAPIRAAMAAPSLRRPVKLAALSDVAPASSPWSRRPFRLGWFRAVNASVTLGANSVTWGRYKFDKASLAATLKDGTLDLGKLASGFSGGMITAHGGVTAGSVPLARLDLDLAGVPLKEVTQSSGASTFSDGVLDLTANLVGAGVSPADLIDALGGTAKLHAHDGAVSGIDLKALNDKLNDIHKPQDVVQLIQIVQRGGDTRFSSLDGDITVDHGVARSDNLHLVADGGDGTATVSINLPEWTQDSRIEFRLGGQPNTPALAINLVGPLDRPEKRIDSQALASFVEKQGLVEALRGTSQPKKPAKQLRDILKSLAPH